MGAITEEQRQFLRAHRLCVFGFALKSGPPSLSPVYYVMDGDDLLISTTRDRAKGRAARRNAEVSLCVLHEEFPFPYLTVFGRARVEGDAAELMARIREMMTGSPVTPEQRAEIEERAAKEGRVVVRVTPERLFATPARGRAAAAPRPEHQAGGGTR
jgi:PPOX class probable F420-dependent enzyme